MNDEVDNNTKSQKNLYHHRNLNEINSHRKINCRFKIEFFFSDPQQYAFEKIWKFSKMSNLQK